MVDKSDSNWVEKPAPITGTLTTRSMADADIYKFTTRRVTSSGSFSEGIEHEHRATALAYSPLASTWNSKNWTPWTPRGSSGVAGALHCCQSFGGAFSGTRHSIREGARIYPAAARRAAN